MIAVAQDGDVHLAVAGHGMTFCGTPIRRDAVHRFYFHEYTCTQCRDVYCKWRWIDALLYTALGLIIGGALWFHLKSMH